MDCQLGECSSLCCSGSADMGRSKKSAKVDLDSKNFKVLEKGNLGLKKWEDCINLTKEWFNIICIK